MNYRRFVSAIALAATLTLTATLAPAFEETKYPNMKGQWVRVGPPNWQPVLGPAPLTPEYKAIYDANRADMTNGGPGKSTETVVLYTYNTFFTSLNFGYGSTLAVMIFLIVVIVSFIYIRVLGAPTQGARR